MRRYTRGGAPAAGSGATRDFAWQLDGAGQRELLPTAAKGRTCRVCGSELSRYNRSPSRLCWPCQRRGDEPLKPEDLVRVFEAVCGALTALWEDTDTGSVRHA